MSHDFLSVSGQTVLMDDRAIPLSDWDIAFRDRIRQIQGKRTQEDMAKLLGISRDRYSKYVGGRKSKMPIWLLPQLARIGEMSVEDLIEGPKAEIIPKKVNKNRKTA